MARLKVSLYGPDEPGATESFTSLTAAREYLEGRTEYWDGPAEGHSDYMRYALIGFTFADIGAKRDECWVKFDPTWKEK